MPDSAPRRQAAEPPWYSGITRYQWLVLVIASLGWVFDTFEGQIFVASMREAVPSLVPAGTSEGRISFYNNVALAAFLVGGAVGGIAFGVMSDRVGRKRTLSYTILFYSVFTCLSAASQTWWHLAGLRFLVALGVGGEWAVAGALVAETFPRRARAHVGSLFHASSVLGAYLAIAAGVFLIGNPAIAAWASHPSMQWVGRFAEPATLPWRLGFAVGVLPALLIVWIRFSLREPETWEAARQRGDRGGEQRLGAVVDLFRGELARRTFVGVALAAVGLATFWSVNIYGKDLLRAAVERRGLASDGQTVADEAATTSPQAAAERNASLKRWEMLGMFLVTTGGGLGLVAFGPICERLGRRGAFLAFHLGGFGAAALMFGWPLDSVPALCVALPAFGFLTLGMHAGYAVYFPELYPTRLRGTGAGFCFNGGRLIAGPMILANGWLQERWNLAPFHAAALCSLLFLVGAAVVAFAPETKGRELAD